VIPHGIVDVEAHKPAVEELGVDRLDQLALAADKEQDLQQRGAEHLRRHRGAAAASIDGLELYVHRRQECIDQGTLLA
jgi:hypothetical protein